LINQRPRQLSRRQFFLIRQQPDPLRFGLGLDQRLGQVILRRRISPDLPSLLFSDQDKVAHDPLLSLLVALQVGGRENHRRSQADFLSFHRDTGDHRKAQTVALNRELSLQILFECGEVWRLLTPQAYQSVQVFRGIEGEIFLHHCADGCLG